MFGCEGELEAADRARGEPRFGFLGDVGRVIVEDELDGGAGRISGIDQRSLDAALDRLVMVSDPSCSRNKRWIFPVGEKHLRPLHPARRLRAPKRYLRQPRN